MNKNIVIILIIIVAEIHGTSSYILKERKDNILRKANVWIQRTVNDLFQLLSLKKNFTQTYKNKLLLTMHAALKKMAEENFDKVLTIKQLSNENSKEKMSSSLFNIDKLIKIMVDEKLIPIDNNLDSKNNSNIDADKFINSLEIPKNSEDSTTILSNFLISHRGNDVFDNILQVQEDSKKNFTSVKRRNLKKWIAQNGTKIDSTRRIFQGTSVRIKRFPFVVSVHVMGDFVCAGAIIGRNTVITAATCLQIAYNNDRFLQDNPEGIIVRAGSDYAKRFGIQCAVSDVFFHPGFSPVTLRNNLVIIKLMNKLHFRGKTKRIRRIVYTREHEIYQGEIDILGWGDKDVQHNNGFDPLSFSRLDIYDYDRCEQIYSSNYVTRFNFCAGFVTQGSGACQRDVGGPAIINSVIVGVVSFGPPVCGTPNAPTVFTNIGFYADWIDGIVKGVKNNDVEINYKSKNITENKHAKDNYLQEKNQIKDQTSTTAQSTSKIPANIMQLLKKNYNIDKQVSSKKSQLLIYLLGQILSDREPGYNINDEYDKIDSFREKYQFAKRNPNNYFEEPQLQVAIVTTKRNPVVRYVRLDDALQFTPVNFPPSPVLTFNNPEVENSMKNTIHNSVPDFIYGHEKNRFHADNIPLEPIYDDGPIKYATGSTYNTSPKTLKIDSGFHVIQNNFKAPPQYKATHLGLGFMFSVTVAMRNDHKLTARSDIFPSKNFRYVPSNYRDDFTTTMRYPETTVSYYSPKRHKVKKGKENAVFSALKILNGYLGLEDVVKMAEVIVNKSEIGAVPQVDLNDNLFKPKSITLKNGLVNVLRSRPDFVQRNRDQTILSNESPQSDNYESDFEDGMSIEIPTGLPVHYTTTEDRRIKWDSSSLSIETDANPPPVNQNSGTVYRSFNSDIDTNHGNKKVNITQYHNKKSKLKPQETKFRVYKHAYPGFYTENKTDIIIHNLRYKVENRSNSDQGSSHHSFLQAKADYDEMYSSEFETTKHKGLVPFDPFGKSFETSDSELTILKEKVLEELQKTSESIEHLMSESDLKQESSEPQTSTFTTAIAKVKTSRPPTEGFENRIIGTFLGTTIRADRKAFEEKLTTAVYNRTTYFLTKMYEPTTMNHSDKEKRTRMSRMVQDYDEDIAGGRESEARRIILDYINTF